MHRSWGSTALALALGFGVASSDAGEVRQPPHACDESGDGLIDADEARTCREREFDQMTAREAALTEDRLSAMRDAEEGAGPTFAEIDADGDGAISRDGMVGLRRSTILRRGRGQRRQDERRGL